jgi:omega-amidase
MPNLNVTLCQAPLSWEAVDANLAHFDPVHRHNRRNLPPRHSAGNVLHGIQHERSRAWLRSMDGKAVSWICNKAVERNVVITGSLMIREKQNYYTGCCGPAPTAAWLSTTKSTCFGMQEKKRVYTAGSRRVTVELNGWKIRPFICYDLRFPIWTRNLNLSYDLAFFVANWPAKRAAHWRALLRARAIENQAYMIGVNRVGVDGNGFDYSGNSMVIDPHRKNPV